MDLLIYLIKELFIARKDAYAKQVAGKGYLCVKEPVSDGLISTHLKGSRKGRPFTMGIYQLMMDNKVIWAVIDFDLNSPQPIRNYIHIFKKQILLIKSFFEKTYGLSLNVEFSGKKGFHLWLFMEEPVEAWKVKGILEEIMSQIEWLSADINYEIFPKQTKLDDQKVYGNLVKLPFGIHQDSGKRSFFMDEEFRKINHLIPFLKSIKRISSEKIDELAEELGISERQIENDDSLNHDNESFKNCQYATSPIDEIYAHCRIFRQLKEKIESKGVISQEQKLILRRTFAWIPGGDKEIHRLESLCSNYDRDHTQNHIKAMTKYKYKPVSCGRLCGCDEMRKAGGGSPIWFAYRRRDKKKGIIKEA